MYPEHRQKHLRMIRVHDFRWQKVNNNRYIPLSRIALADDCTLRRKLHRRKLRKAASLQDTPTQSFSLVHSDDVYLARPENSIFREYYPLFPSRETYCHREKLTIADSRHRCETSVNLIASRSRDVAIL
jgi:hypothetical protein